MVGRGTVEDRLRTIAQERAHLEMMMELENLEVDVRDWKLRQALIPAEWHAIERTVPVRPRRKKVTVALDADVAKWFQGLGEGYHRRINAVLRTFMLALISKEILSRGDRDRHGDEILGEGGAEEEGGVRGPVALAAGLSGAMLPLHLHARRVDCDASESGHTRSVIVYRALNRRGLSR